MELFHWPGSCSTAVTLALHEADLAFERRLVNVRSGEQNDPAYRAINPNGRVPVLSHDGFRLTEIAAILPYIAALSDKDIWPTDPKTVAEAQEWISFGATSLHVAYAHIRRTSRYAISEQAQADIAEKGYHSCAELWERVEERLQDGRQWFVGDAYSLVDSYFFVFWNWGRAEALRFDMANRFPAWTAIMRRLAQRPAAQAALLADGIDIAFAAPRMQQKAR